MKVITLGVAAVLAFDLVASLAARAFGLPYAWASVGSYLLYFGIGYFAARAATGSPVSRAAIAAAAAGLADASVGWAISWWLGPGRTPEAVPMTPGKWMAVAMLVVALGAGIGALGGLAGRRRVSAGAPAA